MNWRFGVSTWGIYKGFAPSEWPTLGDAVRSILVADPGFGVEVWATKIAAEPRSDDSEEADLQAACRHAAFVSVHMRGAYWTWDARAFRDEIDFAARIGARTLVVHPVSLRLDHPDARPDYPEIVRILHYARERGVLVLLENIIDTMWALDRALEEIGDDPEETNLGICLDLGHVHLSHDAGRHPVVNYIDRYAAQLRHLHLHDNHGAADDHLVPGKGTIAWRDAVNALDRIGFSETSIFEMEDAQAGSVDAALRARDALLALDEALP